jgi:hypothetical protein
VGKKLTRFKPKVNVLEELEELVLEELVLEELEERMAASWYGGGMLRRDGPVRVLRKNLAGA